jgi:hypothetical protein
MVPSSLVSLLLGLEKAVYFAMENKIDTDTCSTVGTRLRGMYTKFSIVNSLGLKLP